MIYRNFIRSNRKMREFRLADADALNQRTNNIIIVFKDEMTTDSLPPELQTYRRMNLCVEASEDDETGSECFGILCHRSRSDQRNKDAKIAAKFR